MSTLLVLTNPKMPAKSSKLLKSPFLGFWLTIPVDLAAQGKHRLKISDRINQQDFFKQKRS